MKLDIGVASCGLMIHLQGAASVCVTHDLVWLFRKSSMNNLIFFTFCMSFCLKFLELHQECFQFFSHFERSFHIHMPLNVNLGISVMWTLFREGFIKYFLWEVINKILKLKYICILQLMFNAFHFEKKCSHTGWASC